VITARALRFIQTPSNSFENDLINKDGVNDGTRTHDDWNHNPGLYQLSYTHHKAIIQTSPLGKTGAPGRTRTCNPRLRRPMLYPVELRAQRDLT
jgi:hypothetical protein